MSASIRTLTLVALAAVLCASLHAQQVPPALAAPPAGPPAIGSNGQKLIGMP